MSSNIHPLSNMKNNIEKIVCSAIYYNDGKIYPHKPRNITVGITVAGLRHCQCYEILARIFPNKEYKGNQIEGFITTSNLFVNRLEAGIIAYIAGQIEGFEKELRSEDLY